MFRLGNLVASSLGKADEEDYVLDSIILFFILWLTWHHVNMLYTRFSLDAPWDLYEYAVMVAGSLALAPPCVFDREPLNHLH